MKRNIFIISLSAVLLFAFGGCSDYLDVNHDPVALEEIPDAKVLLPAAEVGIANNLMGWHFGFSGAFWVEYWTQNYSASQFKSLCEYLPTDFNTAYQSLMSQPMADLKRMKSDTEGDENKGYYFIAEALSIFTWQVITDLWGDMPYTEALRAEEGLYHPKQDQGQDIYADLLRRVDELLTIDLSESSIDGHYDYIFDGEMEAWWYFAHALKLKLMLRLSETPGFDANALYDYIFSHEDEIFYFASSLYGGYGGARIPGRIWDDTMEGKRHPMREFQAGGANYLSQNVIGCKTLVDYLKINGDPRLATLFSGNEGAFFGDFDSKADSDEDGTPDDKEDYCTVRFAGDMDLFLLSSWEVLFAVAEVAARAGDMDNAQWYYEQAVMESLEQHGIASTAIIEAAEGEDGQDGYALWQGGSVEACIKQIAMQKWIAHCNYQHIEAFLERNRTKYPSVSEIDIRADRPAANLNFPTGSLTISVNGRTILNGNLPASPLYPEVYITRNNNAPSQKPNVGQKVWWDQKAGK
ncbi:MAG: SusD/RagB family nutrient-binding outer membrane lipoprotein [Tannerella sp.]|jgi:hypothetical protein|nr:SusD/RagB family nutrient-binding outer membrane lipoprotein [Tannerella sp.]